jgi:hypothetical protein
MSSQFANIHDAFFRQSLSDPTLAGKFLREHLPPGVAGQLGPELPEPVPGSFVDEELRQHHSDLLFRVHLKAGRDAFAYVLMEHKSSPDKGARLQLLRYVVRVLSKCYEQSNRRLPLPPVLPLLAHQGPEGWGISCEFSDLFGDVPAALRPYLPSFHHALVDLGQLDDPHLSADVRLRAFLKALKYSRRDDLPDCIDIVLAEAPVLGTRDLLVILTYLDKGPVAVNSKLMHDTLMRLVPDRKEGIVGWFSQPFYDEGMAKGQAEGKAEGKAEGAAAVLARLLEKRFGVVPSVVHERIVTADVASIMAWVERVLDAPDLQSVFDAN